MYVEWFVTRLIVDDGVCRGVVAYDMTKGGFQAFTADAVIMATGGAGRTYGNSTNAIISTGYGMAMAYHAGVPLKDMEFVQFHPTGLYTTNILMTEGARGEGGYLLNDQGERFMQRYAPKAMELAPRDIISRSIQTEINEGRGIEGEGYVYLDLRHLGAEKILERLPGIRDLAIHFDGVDPIEEPIPILPSQHYSMGGIDTDTDGKTDLPGFYRRGRVRLRVRPRRQPPRAATLLLETVVFGRRAGAAAAHYIQESRTHKDSAPAGGRAVAAMEARVGELATRPPRRRPFLCHPGRDDHRDEGPLQGLPRRPHDEGRLGQDAGLEGAGGPHRPAARRCGAQPGHDPHGGARRHRRRCPYHRGGRPGPHRVARLARRTTIPSATTPTGCGTPSLPTTRMGPSWVLPRSPSACSSHRSVSTDA